MNRIFWIAAVSAAGFCGYLLGAAASPENQLLEADRAFDQAVSERGVDAWVSWFAPDGKMLPAGGDVVEGREAIRKLMAPAFGRPGFSLRWKPVHAEIARSGDLGYTWGRSESRAADAGGKEELRNGKYLTVWRRQPDGTWKVAADIGNTRPAEKPASY